MEDIKFYAGVMDYYKIEGTLTRAYSFLRDYKAMLDKS